MPSTPPSDPIDGTDPAALRREMLRLRDESLGDRARAEVLEQRVTELETELHQLGAHRDALQQRLDRSPIELVRRAAGRVRRARRGIR